MTYRVIVSETQHYEVYVEAEDRHEAEDIALEEYGCNGTIFSTFADITHIERKAQA